MTDFETKAREMISAMRIEPTITKGYLLASLLEDVLATEAQLVALQSDLAALRVRIASWEKAEAYWNELIAALAALEDA